MIGKSIENSLAVYLFIAGLVAFATIAAGAGLDLKNSMLVPIAAAGFAAYSAIAYWADRRKGTR